MLKKIVSFILVQILWPILREVLTDVLRHFIKVAVEAFKDLMRRWEKEEVARASDEGERQEIREKYQSRQRDIDLMGEKLHGAAERVVANALVQGEQLRAELLQLNSPALKSLEEPKSSSPDAA